MLLKHFSNTHMFEKGRYKCKLNKQKGYQEGNLSVNRVPFTTIVLVTQKGWGRGSYEKMLV